MCLSVYLSTSVPVFVRIFWMRQRGKYMIFQFNAELFQHIRLSVFLCFLFVSVYLCWSISRWERYMIFFQFNTEPTLRNDSPCAPALLTWDPKLLTDNFFFFIARLLFHMFMSHVKAAFLTSDLMFPFFSLLLNTKCSYLSANIPQLTPKRKLNWSSGSRIGVVAQSSIALRSPGGRISNQTSSENWTRRPLSIFCIQRKPCGYKNIARIANAVQVTICLLVSTSVY